MLNFMQFSHATTYCYSFDFFFSKIINRKAILHSWNVQKQTTGRIYPIICRFLFLKYKSWVMRTSQYSSVKFSHSVMPNSLWFHGLQQARHPCPSPTPRVTQTHVHWVSDAIQPSHPLSSQSPPALSFPASGPFPMSQFIASGGQCIGVSASTSVLPMNIQDWFPLEWTGWISLQCKDSQKSSPTPQFKSINSSALSFL